mmetsp:Transcript_13898/g.30295  ORF Transcript_13898/g.30295 Transcript_13898/m.30295 type:complete len:330 (+) Transcript_13898:280-1269(+)|eukprot:CAMPEP_0172299124 /NCGR_PEP_ID=MMETSP1058-20130122/1492_1 /TAXON_ID=83371 /ORGANISM="Detonula confervacea, Strain CCMP 353" /LENGTH=329 /DNA_ID=CAMNT_0013008455 /DNA_START=260 /DNA_END=1249 /DNA_ORIENTATION=+
MMTAHRINQQLEFSASNSLTHHHETTTIKLTRNTSSYHPSSSVETIPEMISCGASVNSCSESDEDSLSSSMRSTSSTRSTSCDRAPQQSPVSPRSIFRNYWSSPTHKNSLEKGNDEDEVLTRLQTLRLPLVDDDGNDDDGSSAAAAKVVQAPPTSSIDQKASFDDASIDYQASPSRSPTKTRRQILPTPPPSTAISSSLIMPRQQPMFVAPYTGSRKWNSTPALIKHPHQSCLRKTRYSCSSIATISEVTASSSSARGSGRLHHTMRNNGQNDLIHHHAHLDGSGRPRAASDPTGLKKSVKFYSHVSVFEFAVPVDQRRSQKGWSKYFA